MWMHRPRHRYQNFADMLYRFVFSTLTFHHSAILCILLERTTKTKSEKKEEFQLFQKLGWIYLLIIVKKIIPLCALQECESYHKNMQELPKNVSPRQMKCKCKIKS